MWHFLIFVYFIFWFNLGNLVKKAEGECVSSLNGEAVIRQWLQLFDTQM